ncbi:hypothetical protein PACTADRAFT_87388 [Pachysolen tannophilus NRRL Y-2460]|uniref:Uncharacterized protein n=1 Tax=Pachysolen tannophilus NRRL Y-2460 TaxID=669874 RepID=A0A1E4TN66_PACTA|nr:hypothetical protein PACTADRAFT_87388 [Pachysolen tannophilus NRRL Y-2460]
MSSVSILALPLRHVSGTKNFVGFSSLRYFSKSLFLKNLQAEYEKEIDDYIFYERQPKRLKPYLFRPKHASDILAANMIDKETGRPILPIIFKGNPKKNYLLKLISGISNYEDFLKIRNYIFQLAELNTGYLNDQHIVNFLFKSVELGKFSIALTTVYTLKNLEKIYTENIVKAIFFLQLLKQYKLDKVTSLDMDTLNSKLNNGLKNYNNKNLESYSSVLNLLAYSNFFKNYNDNNFDQSSSQSFTNFTKPYLNNLTSKNFQIPQANLFSKIDTNISFVDLQVKEILENHVSPFLNKMEQKILIPCEKSDLFVEIESQSNFYSNSKTNEEQDNKSEN